MNITNKIAERLPYSYPHIERIELDNEISLTLQSDTSPEGEPVGGAEYYNNDPFKTNLA